MMGDPIHLVEYGANPTGSHDVMAVHDWASNAHMLADLFRVMPPPDGRWCDLTYGAGRWWRKDVNPAPDGMVRCVGPGTANPAPHDVVTDFRATPFSDNEFAVTAYDPPYVLKGSDARFAAMAASYGVDDAHRAARTSTPARPVPLPRTTPRLPQLGPDGTELLAVAETIARVPLPKGWRSVVDVGDDDVPSIWLDGHGRHALIECHTDGRCTINGVGDFASIFAAIPAICGPLPEPTRKQALETLICDGLAEAARITRPGGWILAKAGRGIDGGKPFATDDLMARHGHALGLVEVTSMWLLSTPRPQAHRGPQKSPRNNASRLTVFEVPA